MNSKIRNEKKLFFLLIFVPLLTNVIITSYNVTYYTGVCDLYIFFSFFSIYLYVTAFYYF